MAENREVDGKRQIKPIFFKGIPWFDFLEEWVGQTLRRTSGVWEGEIEEQILRSYNGPDLPSSVEELSQSPNRGSP